MHKSIMIVALVCTFAVASILADPIPESAEVKEGMKSAFQAGLAKFGNAIARNDVRVPMPDYRTSKVFSQYTRGFTALGGGKPLLREQYRQHNFLPLAPSVVAPEHSVVTGKMTAEQAAERHVPKPAYQFTTDILAK